MNPGAAAQCPPGDAVPRSRGVLIGDGARGSMRKQRGSGIGWSGWGSGRARINSQRRSVCLGFRGQAEKCVLAVRFDRVACTVGAFHRCGHAGPPVRTGSLFGWSRSASVWDSGSAAAAASAWDTDRGRRWSESCETRTLRAGADGGRWNTEGRQALPLTQALAGTLPIPKTDPLPGAALARALSYGSRRCRRARH
jgi:hypothetical protein